MTFFFLHIKHNLNHLFIYYIDYWYWKETILVNKCVVLSFYEKKNHLATIFQRCSNHPETLATTWHKSFANKIEQSQTFLQPYINVVATSQKTLAPCRWLLHGKHHSIFPQKIKSRLTYYDLGCANLAIYVVHDLGHGLNVQARALLVRIGRCFTIGCLNSFPYQQGLEEKSPEKRGDERGSLTGLDHTVLCSLS